MIVQPYQVLQKQTSIVSHDPPAKVHAPPSHIGSVARVFGRTRGARFLGVSALRLPAPPLKSVSLAGPELLEGPAIDQG
jgi:hypothetical protein